MLVNISRGAHVNKEALTRALDDGQLSGYAADALWEEPMDPEDPLLRCNRVIVTPHVGGITDVVLDGETGLLVPPNNPDELANAVNRIVADPKLGERMGEAGRRRVEDKFTWDRVAIETLSVYNEVTQ